MDDTTAALIATVREAHQRLEQTDPNELTRDQALWLLMQAHRRRADLLALVEQVNGACAD